MRNLITLALVFFGFVAEAQEWEDYQVFNAGADNSTLRIISSTDTDLFAPLIQRFTAENPKIAIEYFVTGTADIDTIFRQNPSDYDIVISSAMDLQLKLTNDGNALLLETVTHQPWAQWRQSLFAFTSEPAAIVINKQAFTDLPTPKSRQDLIKAMRNRPDIFSGRIGTYDIRRSGLGYLFATQDSRASETYWRLMEVIGGLDVQLYCCSGDMIDDLTDGTIAVAYNVLGSYAEARVENGDLFEIINLSDFETTMMRTALVSAETKEAQAAEKFIQDLIDHQSRSETFKRTLPTLTTDQNGVDGGAIALEPALMTFLDNLKRSKFIEEWESAIIQD